MVGRDLLIGAVDLGLVAIRPSDRRAGLAMVKANNDVLAGITAVTAALAGGMTISPGCSGLGAAVAQRHGCTVTAAARLRHEVAGDIEDDVSRWPEC